MSRITASNRSSWASTTIFWLIKLTVTLFTPATFLAASSILAAQLAQSTSSLNFFCICCTPFLLLSAHRPVYSEICSSPRAIMERTCSSSRE